MANDINLSASIRTNLLSLQSTNALFERTSERLSTGLKVNSALDGTSAFFSARSLNNRASDLAALKDGMGQAIMTLKAADKGIEALTKLVSQAKTIAEQAKEASAQVSKKESTATTTTGTTATTLMSVAFGAAISLTNTFIINVANAVFQLSHSQPLMIFSRLWTRSRQLTQIFQLSLTLKLIK